MKLQTLLGNRIHVRPVDDVKKKEGSILLPETGITSTSRSYITAEVLKLGTGKRMTEDQPQIQVGKTVLLQKSGALMLEDGTRIVSAEDVIAVL